MSEKISRYIPLAGLMIALRIADYCFFRFDFGDRLELFLFNNPGLDYIMEFLLLVVFGGALGYAVGRGKLHSPEKTKMTIGLTCVCVGIVNAVGGWLTLCGFSGYGFISDLRYLINVGIWCSPYILYTVYLMGGFLIIYSFYSERE